MLTKRNAIFKKNLHPSGWRKWWNSSHLFGNFPITEWCYHVTHQCTFSAGKDARLALTARLSLIIPVCPEVSSTHLWLSLASAISYCHSSNSNSHKVIISSYFQLPVEFLDFCLIIRMCVKTLGWFDNCQILKKMWRLLMYLKICSWPM